MWKKLISIFCLIILAGVLGYFLARHKTTANDPNESVIDSLECLRASYESVTDSLLLLREVNDSLSKQKIREVTRYKVVESVRYITENTGIEKIELQMTGDSDTVALFTRKDLQQVDSVIATNQGLTEKVRLDSAIIDTMDKNIKTADTLLIMKDQQIDLQKKKTKKASRKWFGIGAGTGVILTSLLWMLL